MSKKDPPRLRFPRLPNFLLLLGQDESGRNNSLRERLLDLVDLLGISDEGYGGRTLQVLDLSQLAFGKHLLLHGI